jgi:hypothetical protein
MGRPAPGRPPTRMAVITGLCALLATAATCSSRNKGAGGRGAAGGHELVLLATTEMNGQLEPCGCNSDPMGDIARTVALVNEARAAGTPVLVVDGGSLLFAGPGVDPSARAQAELAAATLAGIVGETLRVDAIGLGPHDLPLGAGKVALPRHAVNVPAEAGVPLAAPAVLTAGSVQVGVFGVVAPTSVAGAGLEASDPVAAAERAVAELTARGAQVVVALAHMQRRDAVELARRVPRIDFMLVGEKAPDDPRRVSDAPQQVGRTWLFQPANRGQVVSRLDITVRGRAAEADPPAFADALGPGRLAGLDRRLESLRADVAGYAADPDADPAFVAQKKQELAELEAERAALEKSPVRVPDKGSFFTFTQVAIRKQLPCDGPTLEAKTSLDQAAAEINLAQSTAKGPAAPPPDGKPGFAGIEECGFCHADAVEFWKKTRHAAAWQTLVVDHKQASYDCVGCHVTGWDQPGGATLAFNELLRDVQCEVCHGPGSIHVDKDGKEKPSTMILSPPEDVCLRCHNEEHSDTFDFTPYLRDVTGPGHGAAFREKLGEGPTGHELRRAALEKAGLTIGAGCKK